MATNTRDHPYFHDYKVDVTPVTEKMSRITHTFQLGSSVYQTRDFSAIKLTDDAREDCTCPATNHPTARFCSRCGGAIQRPSAALAWLKGAAVRPIKMVAALVVTPPLIVGSIIQYPRYSEALMNDWRWWVRMIYPTTLKRILN